MFEIFKKDKKESKEEKNVKNPAKEGFEEVNGVVQLEHQDPDELHEQDPHN